MNWDSSTEPVSWKVSGSLQTESFWTLSSTPKMTTINNMLIDEPNQQGLSNKNTASHISKINELVQSFVILIFLINYVIF